MDFKAPWGWFNDHTGYVYMLGFFAVGAYRFSQGAPWWVVALHAALGLLMAFLFHCPLSPLLPKRETFPESKASAFFENAATYEQGELAVLNKGYEPVETPTDGPSVEEILAKHVKGCDQCGPWVEEHGGSEAP